LCSVVFFLKMDTHPMTFSFGSWPGYYNRASGTSYQFSKKL
jgi:hypothetical protein